MSKVDDLIGYASAELGKPYVFGAEGPGAFDCSGLIQYVFAKIGMAVPRTAAQQQRATRPVGTPMPGDLVFWGNPAHHVALYVGNGKVINAPQPGEVVRIQDVWTSADGPEYRRVSGIGTAVAPIIDAGGTGVAFLAGAVDDFLGGARKLVVEGLVVVLGLALVGAGLWRATSPGRRQRVETAKSIIGGGS